jgi:transmembrane sensor
VPDDIFQLVYVMKKNSIPPPELIRKFLSGACTQEEALQVQDWYASFEKEADPLQELSATEQQLLKMRMLTQVMQKITSSQIASPDTSFPGKTKKLIWLLAGAAAAVLLTALSIRWLLQPPHMLPNMVATYTIANTSVNIHQQTLSDGTVVWLKPGASIKYNAAFGNTQRNISMEGEVFFDVATNATHPFVVTTGSLVTEVLGTSFSIRNIAGTLTEVTVLTGKVAVHTPASAPDIKDTAAFILLPDQKMTYTAATGALARETITTAQPSIWKKCDLSFDNATVSNIISTLNKRFAVRIAVTDSSLAAYVLKADFTGMHLPAILAMLTKALDARYEINNQEIILSRN